MTRRAIIPLLVGAAALLFASCGGSKTPSGTATSGAAVTSTSASDEAYLRVICGGADNFFNALQTATTTDQLSKVIEAFIFDLQQADPPSDLTDFNGEFIKYLQDAVDNPTSLVSANPPLPPEAARQRLVSKESDVEECKDPTFLDVAGTVVAGSSPSTTP